MTDLLKIERAHLAEFDWALANMRGSMGKDSKVQERQLETEGKSREFVSRACNISLRRFSDNFSG